MKEKVQKALQNSSGGKFANFIQKEVCGRIPYHTILTSTMNILVKIPTTSVLKGILNFL